MPAEGSRTARAQPRIRTLRATLVLTVAVWGYATPAGCAYPPESRLRQQFTEAGRAYDQGRMPEAVRLYEELIRSGPPVMEVFFNAGNASFRDGRLGLAVLYYRKAWRLAPRDPDIEANLTSALRTTGAAEADLSGAEVVFTFLSEGEWAILATSAWWLTCLLLGVAAVVRGNGWLFLRIAVVTGAVAVVGLSGIWIWRGFERNPELVVLNGVQSALQAPSPAATPRFPLPEGSVVRARGHQGEWVEVASGQLTGWIRRAACEPVLLQGSPQ
jgi:hypothetical protein